MESLRCEFLVPFAYEVVFGEGVWVEAVKKAVGGARFVVVVERAVAAPPHHTSLSSFSCVVMEGGEVAKKDGGVFEEAVGLLAKLRLDRHGYVVMVGGGAFLDAVGFAASVVHRGVRQVRVPTTVLSQCDGGVGVKNGIDGFGQKNFLGVFAPPHLVVCDYRFLETLPDGVFRDGFAEMVKVGLIRDGAFFEWVERESGRLVAREKGVVMEGIRRCAELHLRQIGMGGDPFERGSARPLDFGHWAAHKLEVLSGFRISHGRAVAMGMVIDCLYGERVGVTPAGVAARVKGCLEGLGFDLAPGFDVDVSAVMRGLEEFREHLGGALCVTLISAVGKGVEVGEIDLKVMEECVGETMSAECKVQGAERVQSA